MVGFFVPAGSSVMTRACLVHLGIHAQVATWGSIVAEKHLIVVTFYYNIELDWTSSTVKTSGRNKGLFLRVEINVNTNKQFM